MPETARLRLPVLAAAQAQKHVTHNEALVALDTLTQLSVLDKDLAAPPGSPAEGDCYIVAAGASGAWTGWEGRIARYEDGQWRAFLPGAGEGLGWLAYVQDEGTIHVRTGGGWTPVGAAMLGLGSAALEDYEAGTWTPTIAGSTTPGTYAYSAQAGAYRCIGDLVYVQFSLTVQTVTSAGAGAILIGGLPFGPADLVATSVFRASSIAAPPSNFGGYSLRAGSGNLVAQYINAATGSQALTAIQTQVQAGTQLLGAISYLRS